MRIHAWRREYADVIMDFLYLMVRMGNKGAVQAAAVMQWDVNTAMRIKSAALTKVLKERSLRDSDFK